MKEIIAEDSTEETLSIARREKQVSVIEARGGYIVRFDYDSLPEIYTTLEAVNERMSEFFQKE